MERFTVMKKVLLGFLSGAMLLSHGVLAEETSSEDFSRVLERQWLSNLEDGNFHPDRGVTRAELATVMVKAFEVDKRKPAAKSNISFSDVPESHWAYPAIKVMFANDLMKGYRAGQFYPAQQVTRAEGFAIIAQSYGVFQFKEQTVQGILDPFEDSEEIPGWARKAMATAVDSNMVNITEVPQEEGEPKRKLNPSSPMTRRDLAYALTQYSRRAR